MIVKPSWMLDTNVLSELIRNPRDPITEHFSRLDSSAICTSAIVASELRVGARRKGSATLTERVELLLDAISVLAFGPPADMRYADIRSHLELAGSPIGSYDLFIAAHARSVDMTLVTRNLREFTRVPNLRVEDWSTRS